MRKEIYLIKGAETEKYQAFKDRVLLFARRLSENDEVIKLKLVYTKKPPPKFSVIPFKKEKIASVSVFTASGKSKFLAENETGFAGSYTVEEAIPIAYEKRWNDMEETPGACLLTLFQKNPGIDYDTFIDRWHNSHTPLSLKIHPLWNYNRNVVNEKLSEKSENWDGIVEEHFRTSSDLLNPIRFFGNPLTMVYNMLRVYADTRSFLNYQTIKPFYATEIHLKS